MDTILADVEEHFKSTFCKLTEVSFPMKVDMKVASRDGSRNSANNAEFGLHWTTYIGLNVCRTTNYNVLERCNYEEFNHIEIAWTMQHTTATATTAKSL